ncbi:MAG: DUF4870 domain-containing protein [Chthoniobacterales bacterium]
MLVHAIALIGFFVPVGGHIVGPLVIWLARRGDSPELDEQGKESVNFQISMLIYNAAAALLCLIVIGFALLGVLHILNVVFVIIASIQASHGKVFRYPLSLRLMK